MGTKRNRYLNWRLSKSFTSHPGHTRCKYFNREVILRARIVWPEELILAFYVLIEHFQYTYSVLKKKKKKRHHSFNRIYCHALLNTFMQTPWNPKMLLYKSLSKSIFIFHLNVLWHSLARVVTILEFITYRIPKNIDNRYSKTSTEHRSTEWKWKLQLPVI